MLRRQAAQVQLLCAALQSSAELASGRDQERDTLITERLQEGPKTLRSRY